jgi:hypothetical protein
MVTSELVRFPEIPVARPGTFCGADSRNSVQSLLLKASYRKLVFGKSTWCPLHSQWNRGLVCLKYPTRMLTARQPLLCDYQAACSVHVDKCDRFG